MGREIVRAGLQHESFIAGATKQIHIGHGVICLPPQMNHPVKVAERVALLCYSIGLAEFLKNPLKSHPSGWMPSFKLNADEARAIAMYLLREQLPADA